MTNWWQHFNDLGFGYLSKGSRKLFIFIMTNRRFLSFRWKSNIFSSAFHVVAREQLKRCCKVNCCGNRILNNKSKFSHNSNTFLSGQPPAAKRLYIMERSFSRPVTVTFNWYLIAFQWLHLSATLIYGYPAPTAVNLAEESIQPIVADGEVWIMFEWWSKVNYSSCNSVGSGDLVNFLSVGSGYKSR